MALIACKECNHQISNKSHSCVNCGAPNTKGSRTSITAIFSLLFVVVNVIMALVFINSIVSNSTVVYVVSMASMWGSLAVVTGLPVIMMKMR